MSKRNIFAGKDYYKALSIEATATAKEIKDAYYKVAMRLHPDKHDGDPKKITQFQLAQEAYDILSDESKRHQYDFIMGRRYNKNRRTAPPPNYRKVYTVRPPPHWKTVWDEAKWYDMHYGDGLQKEAIVQARREYETNGAYQSKLGKGFAFSNEPLFDGNVYNPYSTRKQGPEQQQKVVFEYSEETNLGSSNHQTRVSRQSRIVEDLHVIRNERKERETMRQRQEDKRRQHANLHFCRSTIYSSFDKEKECQQPHSATTTTNRPQSTRKNNQQQQQQPPHPMEGCTIM